MGNKNIQTYLKTCLQCGILFNAKKPFAKYCSITCKYIYLKKNKKKDTPLLKLYKKEFISEDVFSKVKNWNEIPERNKKVLIDKASFEETVFKLKEIGYPKSLASKPFSFSEDGKILVTMNMIQQFRIECLD